MGITGILKYPPVIRITEGDKMPKEKKRRNEKKLSRSPDVGFGIFKNHEAEWVVNRTLTFMNEKAAEIGECLYTAKRIAERDETDVEIWIEEWAKLASRIEKDAIEALEVDHLISARELFLRASNYYRTAEYSCPPDHPRFHELWKKSVESFRQVCQLLDPKIQQIEINYKGKKLPGYFWAAKKDGGTYPTLIAVGGNASPSGHITLIPASATMGLSPIVLNKSTSGTPNTAADPYISTDSVMGRKIKRLPITRNAGKVMKEIASNPRTPVSVMI